jgi:hypothetical protein
MGLTVARSPRVHWCSTLSAEALWFLGLGLGDPSRGDPCPIHDLADPLEANATLFPRAPKMAQFLIPSDDVFWVDLPGPWDWSRSIDHGFLLLTKRAAARMRSPKDQRVVSHARAMAAHGALLVCYHTSVSTPKES